MYKVVVNVSGKQARLVPAAHRLLVSERNFGEISQADAMNNKDTLEDAIRQLLADRDQDPDLYTISLPDDLSYRYDDEDTKTVTDDPNVDEKGPVTKPVNPKEGEVGSETEPDHATKASGKQPTETEVKEPVAKEKAPSKE